MLTDDNSETEYSYFQPKELFRQAQTILDGRYELQSIQIETESGMYCRAHDRTEGRDLTIKLFPPLITGDPKCIENLQRESKRSLKLSHKNVWRLYSFEIESGLPYLRLELLSDSTIRSLIGMKCNGPRIKKILAQCISSIRYAHSKDILHGDIRPVAFSMDSDDNITTIEFGVSANVTATMTRLTGKKAKGANLYSAPEFIQGRFYGRSSEFYSLACVMYELLTDSPPFESGDLAYQHLNEEPEPLGESFRREYGFVVDFISAGLIKDPERRLAEVDQLIEQLDQGKQENNPPKKREIVKRIVQPKNIALRVGLLLALTVTAFSLGFVIMQVFRVNHNTSVLSELDIELYKIRGQTFGMGDKTATSDMNNPFHPVRILQDYMIGKTEVSRAQYVMFLNETTESRNMAISQAWIEYANGKFFLQEEGSKLLPATGIRWDDAQRFCNWLSSIDEGWTYRLPTEAEWELGARGHREDKKYPWGDEIDPSRLNCNADQLREVNTFQQNENVCNIVGNAAEWVFDFYDKDYYRNSPADDPQGPAQGNEHVVRGGSYRESPEECTVSKRKKGSDYPDLSGVGFRIVKARLRVD